jgi:hypothetical protein
LNRSHATKKEFVWLKIQQFLPVNSEQSFNPVHTPEQAAQFMPPWIFVMGYPQKIFQKLFTWTANVLPHDLKWLEYE